MKLTFKKTPIKRILFVLLILVAFSCASKAKPDAATTSQETPQIEAGFIAGTVTAITFGKDGYTATISDVNKNEFDVTISRANLKNASTYREVKVGETIEVRGDRWQLEGREKITVREIK